MPPSPRWDWFFPFLDSFKVYENEDDATKDLAEFSLANAIYAALVESHACEQSARYVYSLFIFSSLLKRVFLSSQTAMDNASKNAKDMIGSLQMKYNRGRQAAITNELVDIITGKFSKIFDLVIIILSLVYNQPLQPYFAFNFIFWEFDLLLFFTGASALWEVRLLIKTIRYRCLLHGRHVLLRHGFTANWTLNSMICQGLRKSCTHFRLLPIGN